jgi:hypothetical protein
MHLHRQRIARVRQVVSKLGDDPAVRQMVIEDIGIPSAADTAVVVAGAPDHSVWGSVGPANLLPLLSKISKLKFTI